MSQPQAVRVFFGAAIQAHQHFGERQAVYERIINLLRERGIEVCTEHTSGRDRQEILDLMEKAIGPIPPSGSERTMYVRDKMIEFVEGEIAGAIFEVSTPSLGTGIELAHAYLRPRMNRPAIPILALYQKDYWPNNLSTMIRGLSAHSAPTLRLLEYADTAELERGVLDFIRPLTARRGVAG